MSWIRDLRFAAGFVRAHPIVLVAAFVGSLVETLVVVPVVVFLPRYAIAVVPPVAVVAIGGVYRLAAAEYDYVPSEYAESTESTEKSGRDADRGPLSWWISTTRETGPPLLAGAVVAHTAALLLWLPLAVVVGSLWLVPDTAYRLVLYGQGRDALMHSQVATLLPVFWLIVSFAIVRFGVTFFDAFVVLRNGSPWRTWRSSLRFPVEAPRAFATYGLVVVVVLGIPRLSALVVSDALSTGGRSPLEIALASGLVGVAVGTIALAFVAGFHVATFGRRVVPVVDRPPLRRRLRRAAGPSLQVVMAMLLLTALVVGSAGLRATEHRPMDTSPTPVNEEMPADELLATAVANTERTNFEVEKRTVDAATDHDPFVWEIAVDRQNRRAYVYGDNENGPRSGTYVATGTLASKPFEQSDTDDFGHLSTWRSGHEIIAAPGYSLIVDGVSIRIDPSDADTWTYHDRKGSEVVVETTESEDVGRLLNRWGMEEVTYHETFVRVRIDTETGRVVGAEARIQYTDHGEDADPVEHDIRHRWHVRAGDDVRVDRPGGFGQPQLLEQVFRVVVY